jgi:cell volume regulation protein A
VTVVREGSSIVPGPRTVLRHGDQLLVVVPSAVRDRTESRLHAVSVGGRLAVWGNEQQDKARHRVPWFVRFRR